MGNWKDGLKADPIDWLLEASNPSVRYWTLKDLLDKPDSDPTVQEAKHRIMEFGTVPDILSKQQDEKYRQNFAKFYTAKYNGLVWQLILLTELGASLNQQIKEQCEYLLDHSQETTDGGFSCHAAVKTGGGRISEVIPCLTGNMVWCLIEFGYLGDARLQKAIDWITTYLCLNDGQEFTPQVPPYNHYEMCWGKHTCLMGVVKSLKGLSAIPPAARTKEIQNTMDQCVEFLLIHHIYKRSHDLTKKSKPGWLRFGFPMMYQTDVLEILDILSGLGIRDSRMKDAIDVMLSKQDNQGRWAAENTYCSEKLWVPFEAKGEPSKWLTLKALRVLKRQDQNV